MKNSANQSMSFKKITVAHKKESKRTAITQKLPYDYKKKDKKNKETK